MLYEALPDDTRKLADKNYQILKSDSRYPSLHFKKIGKLWSVRIGAHYRALAVEVEGGLYWIWIGTHAEYDKIVA
jgi:hypothetical protein